MKYFITLLLIAFGVNFSYAQKEFKQDTTKTENATSEEGETYIEVDSTNQEDNFDLSRIHYGEQNLNMMNESYPTIDLFYTMSQPGIHNEDFSAKLAPSAGLELRLGEVTKKANTFNLDLIDMDQYYFFLANYTNDLRKDFKQKTDEIRTSDWSFGIAFAEGLGWKLGDHSDITLYNTWGLSWNKFKFNDTSFVPKDYQKIRDFGTDMRFGRVSEDGIKITLYQPLSINIAYEKSLIFPRTVFWYWAGSEITEAVAGGILNHFVDKIIAKTAAAPIIKWVLNAGLNYGVNVLKSRSMNWPIDTPAPLTMENIKASLSFSF